jgi:hypothetical protein
MQVLRQMQTDSFFNSDELHLAKDVQRQRLDSDTRSRDDFAAFNKHYAEFFAPYKVRHSLARRASER